MATILPFTPRMDAGSRSERPNAQSATIVIFPGVRYEKDRDSAQDGAPATAGDETPGKKTPGAKF